MAPLWCLSDQSPSVTPSKPTMTHPALVSILDGFAPTATTFIVTIYGDIVVPRGGVLWMGNVVELCGGVGISESLARTAVSRLVAAGRLVGTRQGRRSFYRLADPSHEEFAQAALRLYGLPRQPEDWMILHAPDLAEDEARRAGYGTMAPGIYLLPGWMRPGQGMAFRAAPLASVAGLAAQLWDLGALASEYQAMLDMFGPAEALLRQEPAIDGRDALVLRLALVHVFRRILLRDPELPAAALPQDWPGMRARALFGMLYTRLSGGADSFIGAQLEGERGRLAPETSETVRRLHNLLMLTSKEDA